MPRTRRAFAEYWVLAEHGDRWVAANVEPESEWDDPLAPALVSAPWKDAALHDAAVLELAAAAAPDVPAAELAPARSASAAAAAADPSLADPRFGPDALEACVHGVLGAW